MPSAKMSSFAWRRTEDAEFTNMENSNGDITASWGIPDKGEKGKEGPPQIETHCFLPTS